MPFIVRPISRIDLAYVELLIDADTDRPFMPSCSIPYISKNGMGWILTKVESLYILQGFCVISEFVKSLNSFREFVKSLNDFVNS